MQAERAPILGVALAMIVLVIECLGLVAYGDQQRCHQRAVQAPDEPIGTIVLEDFRFVPQEAHHCRFSRAGSVLDLESPHLGCFGRTRR